MQIIVDEYGTFIGKEGERFKIESKEKCEEFAAAKCREVPFA